MAFGGITEPTPELAARVLAHYDLQVKRIELVQKSESKKKAIWRVKTNSGPLCLKRLSHGLDRTLFSLGAQEYVARQGDRSLVSGGTGRTASLPKCRVTSLPFMTGSRAATP